MDYGNKYLNFLSDNGVGLVIAATILGTLAFCFILIWSSPNL